MYEKDKCFRLFTSTKMRKNMRIHNILTALKDALHHLKRLKLTIFEVN